MSQPYDPQACGALCSACPLKGKTVVPPQEVTLAAQLGGQAIAVVGEAPGEQEERQKIPFVGPNGEVLDKALQSAAIRRSNVHATHVLLCRPPGNKLSEFLRKINATNKENERQAKKEGRPPPVPVPSPIDCCKPRLEAELRMFTKFITLGTTATQAVTGSRASIMSVRGSFITLEATDVTPHRGVMPTVHPSFVLKQQRWLHVFRSDLHKAGRAFRGAVEWRPPVVHYHPTAAFLRTFLARTDILHTYDLETDGIESLTAKIRCVGIGTADEVVVCGFLGKDGQRKFYTPQEELEVKQVLCEFFADPNRTKVGHNCLYEGTPVLLADGTSVPIDRLVRQRYAGDVLAQRADGTLVSARVTGWFRQRAAGQTWLVIVRAGEKKGARGLTLTPDHEVYTTRGLIRADAVQAGDFLLDREALLEPDQVDALLGTLLGDSSCASYTSTPAEGGPQTRRVPISEATKVVLRGSHTDKNLVEEKNRWLGGLLRTHDEVQCSSFSPGSTAYCYRTPQMRQIAAIAQHVYVGHKRTLSTDVLDKLGPVGFAWLFADDGGKHKKAPGRREPVLLATCGFSEADREAAVAWFSRRFGPTTQTQAGSLSLSVEATERFILWIAPYLLPSARYKLPREAEYGLRWPEFCGFPARSHKPLPVPVIAVHPFVPPTDTAGQRAKAETRWCIQTTAGNFMTGFGLVKNCGYYDRVVLEQQWGVTPTPIIDTILLHRNVESELPHSLAYVASMYTDAPPWKHDREGNKLSSAAETDEQLHEYNALDVAVTARVVSPLIAALQMRDQVGVWQIDQKMQDVCAGMHTVGMYVDQEKRLKTEKEMFKRRHELLGQIRTALGRPGFNPSSVQQLRALLFEEWKLVPPLDAEDALTSSGDPSTADLVLRALLTDRSIPKSQRDLIKLVRYFRKVQKVLGTYVVKMRPETEVIEDDAVDPNDFELQTLGWDEDEDWVDKETRKKYGLAKRGIVYAATGRMHPGYNAQIAVTGRLSSSKPINAQNYPKGMRGLVVAAPGHVFVGADMDQLELRIAAARWRVQLYLKAFTGGKDPHSMTAYAVFGDAFLKAAGLTEDQFVHSGPLVGTSYVNGKFEGTGEDKKMRDLAKAVAYASQYMATVETVHQLITKTEVPAKDEHGNVREDGTTELPYALMPLSKVREMRDNWLKGAPEFEKGWEQEIQAYRRQGYLREPVTGRRRDFLDGEAPNEIVNFPIQASAAGLMNLALIQLREQIPTHFWGPGTGIVNQCHDSIMVECPADGVELRPVFDAEGKLVLDKKGQPKTKVYVPEGCIAAQVAKQLEACMNQTHPDLPGVTFTATASIGFSWKDV